MDGRTVNAKILRYIEGNVLSVTTFLPNNRYISAIHVHNFTLTNKQSLAIQESLCLSVVSFLAQCITLLCMEVFHNKFVLRPCAPYNFWCVPQQSTHLGPNIPRLHLEVVPISWSADIYAIYHSVSDGCINQSVIGSYQTPWNSRSWDVCIYRKFYRILPILTKPIVQNSMM